MDKLSLLTVWYLESFLEINKGILESPLMIILQFSKLVLKPSNPSKNYSKSADDITPGK